MTKSDVDLIRDTVLDYFEGWFTADVDRMERALHPDLVKRWPGTDHAASLGITTKERMIELTAAGEGRKDAGPIDVTVEDVREDIASVRVRGGVYHEYLHLVRTRDGWKIANALWRFADR
jgi:ketosteroid isomerase-like protein